MAKGLDSWNTRIGVILAVAGSAVGLGNFLRFPGKAAEFGGGAFMLAYFISFLLIGLPICWAEWTMGRHGGQRGFNSSPGILNAIWPKVGKFVGVIAIIIPVVIYMYYVYIEAWGLGYAVNFLRGEMDFATVKESTTWWATFIGAGEDGGALTGFGLENVAIYLLIAFALNFLLIYRGIARGIELFCRFAFPALVVLAVVVLIRVLTLGAPNAEDPHENVMNGLGFLWNPDKTFVVEPDPATGEEVRTEIVDKATIAELEAAGATLVQVTIWEQLGNPKLWLEAAGQIFFSLSVGFGVIITYASYLKRDDDIVLSGLAATSANEFCEVALGGLITVPAAVAFIGVAGLAGVGLGTFDLGFKVMPMVFSEMPFGQLFGFLWFFLLFLAAVTSSISMLQPGIAFIEETMKTDRQRSVAILGLITALGCGFVVFFSKDVKALDTLDFWVGTFLIFVLAMLQIIIFAWIFGLEKGFASAHEGASIKIPAFFKVVMKFICPIFLVTIFALWLLQNLFGINFVGPDQGPTYYLTDLREGNVVSWLSIGLIVSLFVFFTLIVASVQRFKEVPPEPKEEAS